LVGRAYTGHGALGICVTGWVRMLAEVVMSFMNVSLGAPVVRAAESVTGGLGVIGARFILDGGPSAGRFSLVEHPIIGRGMAAPVHRHTREDEYSFILEGRWGFWQGGSVAFAGPGDLVYKPRDVWHTFWNATDEPGRLLEVISPAGFEQFFAELADLIAAGPPDDQALSALNAAYGLQFDAEGTARIAAEYHLVTALPG
jgi:mannose-6-phosphate isomerase-like protein (cupin superfamily)